MFSQKKKAHKGLSQAPRMVLSPCVLQESGMDDLNLCILLKIVYWALTDSNRSSQWSTRLPKIYYARLASKSPRCLISFFLNVLFVCVCAYMRGPVCVYLWTTKNCTLNFLFLVPGFKLGLPGSHSKLLFLMNHTPLGRSTNLFLVSP